MPLTEQIQTLIHKLEVGTGSRYLRIFMLALGVVALAFLYDIRAYRNLATPEAMDAAQLARNISEGGGFTTQFIRPFSLYLVQNHNQAKSSLALTNAGLDFARIKTAHPDISNPPVYPLMLAGLMKVLPFHYAVNLKSAFWANGGSFWRYQPDFLIAIFNEVLLIVAAVLTFLLAENLFDSSVAWLSSALILGSETLWQFSASGLSTMLLLVIFLGLTLLLLEVERSAREPQPHAGWLLGLAVAVGILTGIGALTRYAFGWVIIPAVLFLIFFSGQRRLLHLLVALAAFALVLTPWVIRNEAVSGTAFGTAGYALVEGTFVFPKFQLERSVHPELTHALWLTPCTQKFFGNARGILTDGLLKTFGTFAGALFIAGLFLGFRSTGARRVRYFLLMCLGVFIVVQSLGRTQLSDLSPEINSENLLVLLVPLVFIFSASFFFTLLGQMTLPLLQLRYAVTGLFVMMCCLPLIFALLPPQTRPVVYPPYFTPEIQETAGWMKPDELMMSDVPWAVAWYGNRQCVWLTLNAQDDFYAVNAAKPVQALYLTMETMDGKFVSEWMEGNERGWGSFLLEVLKDNRLGDEKFPLKHAPSGFFPERLFLSDRDRWSAAQ
jgi:4-amino-4-deoxy-L-arabinose transferase-like glycosyltransferase